MNEADKQNFKGVRHNHGLMMLLCCLVPLILLIGAVYLFGLSNKYLYWFIILLCPAMHFWMMKDMIKKQPQKSEEEIE